MYALCKVIIIFTEGIMDLSEKKIDSELKYSGVIVNVMLDHAELCDGSIVKREVVEHPGGVTILPIDDDGFATASVSFAILWAR